MKKCFLCLMVVLSMLVGIIPGTAFANETIDGTYEGWYYANQGQTVRACT